MADGNSWTYQSDPSAATFTIRVGTPFVINGFVYYSVKGYSVESALVRRTEEGNLVQLDMETGVETPLTIFDPEKQWDSPLSDCRQGAETSAKRGDFAGPAGIFPGAVTVNYQPGACADAGFASETYVDHIGLVRRTVNTFAGPVEYNLVAARVGKFTFRADPSVLTRLSIPLNAIQRDIVGEALPLHAVLTVESISGHSVPVTFPTSQRYDLVMRNPAGEIVYRWSHGKVFAEEVSEMSLGRSEFPIEGEIDAATAAGLADGMYTLEASITNGEGPKFAASATVELYTNQKN